MLPGRIKALSPEATFLGDCRASSPEVVILGSRADVTRRCLLLSVSVVLWHARGAPQPGRTAKPELLDILSQASARTQTRFLLSLLSGWKLLGLRQPG